MIRFNANDPMIQGRRQYDVLRGFGIWCIVFAACGCVSLVLLFLNLPQEYTYSALKAGIFILLLLAVMANALNYIKTKYMLVFCGLSMIIMANGRISFLDALFGAEIICVIILFAALFFIFCLGGIGLGIYGWWVHTLGFIQTTRKAEYYIIVAFVMGFLLSLFAFNLPAVLFISFLFTAPFAFLRLIRRAFSEPHIMYFLNNKIDLDDVDADPNEPNIVTVYEKENPIALYGWWLFFYGIVIGVACGIASFVNYHRGNDPQLTRIFLALALGGLVFSGCGYGLAQIKEWARMLAVAIHFFIIVFAIGFAIDSTNPIMWAALFFPAAHWCYFVIRTLTSPAVVYICFRSGYEIE